MPFTPASSLFTDRTTGDSPVGGVAADINLLKAAIAELQGANLALYSEIVQKTPVNPRDSLTISSGDQINASNTGYSSTLLQGSLTVVGTSGSPVSTTITTGNQTIRDTEYWGVVTVNAANVTFKNCTFHGPLTASASTACVNCDQTGISNAVFEDCTFVPQTPSIWVNSIQGSDFTLRRCNLYNGVDGVGVFNTHRTQPYACNVVVEYTYIHDLAYFTPCSYQSDNQTHNDGIQLQGGTGLVVRYSNIQGYYGTAGSSQPTPNANPTQAGATKVDLSCVMFNVNVGDTSGVDIHDNLIGGGYIPFNCAGGATSVGSMLRNKFDGGSLIMTSAKPQTILLKSTQTSTTGDGTANANTFSGGTYSGQEVLVRHNG